MNGLRMTWPAVAAAMLVMVGPAAAQEKKAPPKIPDSVELLKDVEYGTGGGRALKMHILRPRTLPREPMPCLVWVHGGGWAKGDKNSGIGKLAPYAERGYFCASIGYRLSDEAKFPAQIEDCKCAIRFLRAKAEGFKIDPNRIGVWGSSAGGHLVSLLGTSAYVKELEGKGGHAAESSRVNAVCDFCGPSDLIKMVVNSEKGAKGAVAGLLGGAVTERRDLARLASPVTHVTKDAPPFLIVHGDQDKTVPLEQSELLQEALKKAGVRVTLHVAKGQGHGLSGPELDRIVREFFDRELKATK